jgi:ribosomal protein L31
MVVVNQSRVTEQDVCFDCHEGTCVCTIIIDCKTYHDNKCYYYIDYHWNFILKFDNCKGETLNIPDKLDWDSLIQLENKLKKLIKTENETEPVSNEQKQLLYNIECVKRIHPFYSGSNELDDGYDGEIIAKNNMTSSLINMLCLDDVTLQQQSGHSEVSHYRKLLMHNINNLWD